MGDPEDADAETLGLAFFRAYRQHAPLLQGDDVEAAKLAEARGFFAKLARAADALSLFSSNEELDEVATGDLKFLLLPYFLGKLDSLEPDLEKRLAALRRCVETWRLFVSRCQDYALGSADDFAPWNRGEGEALSGEAKRAEKIARYQKNKELTEKVAFLSDRKVKEGARDVYAPGVDEDIERDLTLAWIAQALTDCADQVGLVREEIPLLEMRARGGPAEAGPPPPKLWSVSLKDTAAVRQLFQQQVFRPDIPLPTMSLAEFADLEMAEMERQQRAQAEAEFERAKVISQFDEKELARMQEDAEERKARDWDDWKDHNPRGSGNKMANVG